MNDSPETRAYRLLQRTIAVCAAGAILLMGVVFFWGASSSRNRCEDLQDVRSYVLESTNRAIDSLPTIDYYRTHPDELNKAMENLQRQKAVFEHPLDCSLL